MNIIRDIRQLEKVALAATVGFFDGVHRGHQFLIDELCRHANEKGLRTAVVTFAQHPHKILHSDYQPQQLNTFNERMEKLSKTGVDYVIVMDFTLELASLPAKDFIHHILFGQMNIHLLLVGHDHRFGHLREDGFEQYVSYGSLCGMEVIQATSYIIDGCQVSSSKIRQLVANGRLAEAAKALGYFYPLKGHVVQGKKVGRSIGFPTANIKVEDPLKILPAFGVYAVIAAIDTERRLGMLYIGSRPTMHDHQPASIEVHIFDFEEDLYGKEVTVFFVDFVRADQQFNSLDSLRRQLQSDKEKIHQLLSTTGTWNDFMRR